MPVFLAVVRQAQCVVCSGTWYLEPGTDTPDRCIHCGSEVWEWGVESADIRRLRQGITFLPRRLNPGAASKKRQDRAKAQGQAFQPRIDDKRAVRLPRVNRGRPEKRGK
jgi:hypothetical protein